MTDPVDVMIFEKLSEHLRTPALTSPETPISWPGDAYAPTSGVLYLAVRPVLRATPDHPGHAATDSTLHRGIFQIDVVAPTNKGEVFALRTADLIRARFAYLTEWRADGRRLRISAVPAIGPAIDDAPWTRYPVSIPYLLID